MQNLYVINKNTQVGSTPNYQEPGINDNNELVEVKYTTSPKGNPFLSFTWKNESGAPVTLTEWPPRMDRPFETMSKEDQERIKWGIDSQMSRIKQILEVYIGKIEDEVINSASFEEVAKKVITLLGDSYKDKKVRIKVVYDNRGYTIVSNRANYVFIESMNVPKEETKIKILGGDLMERPKKDKETEDFSFTTTDNSGNKADDNPFVD